MWLVGAVVGIAIALTPAFDVRFPLRSYPYPCVPPPERAHEVAVRGDRGGVDDGRRWGGTALVRQRLALTDPLGLASVDDTHGIHRAGDTSRAAVQRLEIDDDIG